MSQLAKKQEPTSSAPASTPVPAPAVMTNQERIDAVPAASPLSVEMPPIPIAPIADGSLSSPRATPAMDVAFNSLAHTVLVQNSLKLEDLVREMLKPMLKAGLDDNLPHMVERPTTHPVRRPALLIYPRPRETRPISARTPMQRCSTASSIN